MNKIIRLIAIVLALTMLSLPVLAEMTGGNSDGKDANKTDTQKVESGSDNDGSKDKSKEMYDDGTRIRESEDMKGLGFIKREDKSYGSFVTFLVNNNTGDILNFGISGIAVFDSIKIAGFDFSSSRTEGAETRIINKADTMEIKIHDNPAAVIEIKTDTNTTLTYNLAPGVTASNQNNMVAIVAGNITAYIVSEKATSTNITGSQIIINSGNGATIFRASPVNMPHDDLEERFMSEVKTKKAGAEVSVGESDKYSIVNYSENVSVTVDSIEPDRVRMKVESPEHAGKIILMNIDNSSLTWNEDGRISLYLDNQKIKEVLTEQELYNAIQSSFWLNKAGPKKLQALVYIQNFSTRQLDIVVEPQTPTTTGTTTAVMTTATPTKTPGFDLALGAISILVAVYAARRKF